MLYGWFIAASFISGLIILVTLCLENLPSVRLYLCITSSTPAVPAAPCGVWRVVLGGELRSTRCGMQP